MSLLNSIFHALKCKLYFFTWERTMTNILWKAFERFSVLKLIINTIELHWKVIRSKFIIWKNFLERDQILLAPILFWEIKYIVLISISTRYKFVQYLLLYFPKKFWCQKYHDHFPKNQVTNFDRVIFNPVRLCIMIMIYKFM